MDHRTRVRVIKHFSIRISQETGKALGLNFWQFNNFTVTRSRIYSIIGSILLLNIPYHEHCANAPIPDLKHAPKLKKADLSISFAFMRQLVM